MTPNNHSPLSPKTDAAHRAIAGVLFFVSGAIGLIYQVAWIKWFSLLLGNSSWAISSVIAAFMAGLGIGSWWAGKNVHRWSRHFSVYGWIELGIAVLGLVSLLLYPILDVLIAPIYHFWSGQFVLFSALRLLLVFVLLFLPTVLMGASLPVLVVALSKHQSFQGSVGWLYGINTIGAAVGVAATGFYLLPRFGIRSTVLFAAGLGVAVAIGALAWGKTSTTGIPPLPKESSLKTRSKKIAPLFLITVFMTGALSIFSEVVWTRLLTPVLGSSTFAFTVILLVFLLGIGLGGFLSLFVPVGGFRYRMAIGLLLFLNAVLVVAGLFMVNRLPEIFVSLATLANERLWFFFLSQGVLAGSLVFLPSLIMGCVLPLAIVGRYQEQKNQGDVVGQIYFFNTMGAIFGSLAAGFLVLPALGASQAVLWSSAVCAILSLGLIFSEPALTRSQRVKMIVGCAVFFMLLTYFSPQIDFKKLHAGVFRHVLKVEDKTSKGHHPDLLFLKEGHNTTVSIFRTTDDTLLKVGGKTDASMFGDLSTQYLLGHLPLFLAPDAKNVCIIGYGSGATVRAVAGHSVESIDVIELEPAIMEAGRYFEHINNNVLSDSRVKVHLEDGRTFLKYAQTKFDVIVSEPSNPWVAGVSSLFTTEYYQIVRERLSTSGVYCQWIQMYELSNESMNGMLNTLAREFAHVILFVNKGDLICLASNQPIRINDSQQLAKILSRPDVAKTLNDIGLGSEYDVFLGYCGAFPEDAKFYPSRFVNTDDNLWLEFRAPIEMYKDAPLVSTPPPATSLFPRMCELFYPLRSQNVVAKGVAQAIERTRSYAHGRIDGIRDQLSEPMVKSELSRIAVRSREKAEKLARQENDIVLAAKLMDEKKDYAGAIKILEKIHRDQPRHRLALRNLGWAHFQAGQYSEAQRLFTKAVELNPFDFISMNFLGATEFQRGNKELAERAFRKTIEINPFFQLGWINLISHLNNSGRADEAKRISLQSRAYSREWSVLQ